MQSRCGVGCGVLSTGKYKGFYMVYKYICVRCNREYKYNVQRCTMLVHSDDTGVLERCGCKVRMVVDSSG